jgi:hypothetical protein
MWKNWIKNEQKTRKKKNVVVKENLKCNKKTIKFWQEKCLN